MAKTWRDAISEATFVSAAVVDKNVVVFTLNNVDIDAEQDSYEARNRPQKGKDKTVFCDIRNGIWAGKTYNPGGFHFANCAGGRTPDGSPQALFVESGGKVSSFIFPDGPRGLEDPMPLNVADKVAFIGDHFYACGMVRRFLRRKAAGQWEVLWEQPAIEGQKHKAGQFIALDGLTEDNIFLGLQKNDVTTHAQVARWDGARLTYIDLPEEVTTKNRDESSIQLGDLIVAPNGRVFVSGNDGELLMGGETGFVSLTDDKRPSYQMNQLCWFQGVLYGGHDMLLFRFDFDAGKWVPALFPGDNEAPATGAPYIDANEDIMVVAGAYDANVYDGDKWTRIAGTVGPIDILRMQLQERQVDDLADLRDTLRDIVDN